MQSQFLTAQQNLKKFWGYDAFRPGQDEVVRSVFEGQDTLVLFPTGGGKSLCYQVPATVFEGMTLVISPLVALMQDQVQQLNEKGISATFINSTIPNYEVEQRLVNARNGMYKLLYCAPERLKTPLWNAELPNLNIELVAIDEAHCISEWGHEFRPSYREIKSSLEPIADKTRWIALTATATPEVKKDILENLDFKDPKVHSRGFSRPNLKWWIVHTDQKRKKLIEVVKKASKTGDGLIYGGTRKNCEELAELFGSQGIRTETYHAGIQSEKRKAIQQRWISGETPLVAATNAFGMGIDKPDCRYVVHDEMPYSIEAYYQEAGRAGRDGKESFPVLLFKDSDYKKATKRLEESYPTRSELEDAYRSLCESFDLAVGDEMFEALYLNLEQIKKRSGLSARKIHSSIRLLNQLDIIAVEEQFNPAVHLQFIRSREALTDYKNAIDNAEKREFVDKIERLFGQEAFVKMAKVEESVILEKLKINHNALIKALDVLMRNDAILKYEFHKAQTLVRLLESRSSKLPITRQQVESHRNNLFKKLEYMHGFIKTGDCREVYLRNYFGDSDAEPCGHCDNCLKPNSQFKTLNSKDIYAVSDALSRQDCTVGDIQSITNINKKSVVTVLRHLIQEEKATTDPAKPGYYKLLQGSSDKS